MSAEKEHRRLLRFLQRMAKDAGYRPDVPVSRGANLYQVRTFVARKWIAYGPLKLDGKDSIGGPIFSKSPDLVLLESGLSALRDYESQRRQTRITVIQFIWSPVAALLIYLILPALSPLVSDKAK